MGARFTKTERLKSRKLIEAVFEKGSVLKKGPLRIKFLEHPDNATHQVAFAVPKRNFKSAVKRNRIKRQLREAYRLHKHLLSQNSGKKFALVFLYISKDIPTYQQLEKSVAGLLTQLAHDKD